MTTNEKTNDVPPKFGPATLQRMLLKNDYGDFPDSHFEPSSNKPIGKDKKNKNQLTSQILLEYLNTNYGTGDTLEHYDGQIEKIIGNHRFKRFIDLIELRSLEVKQFEDSIDPKDLKDPKYVIDPKKTEQLEESEHYKMLTHFSILSKVKKGWFNLFVTSPIRTSKPSLSDTPSCFAFNDSKKLHDAIIRCFYSRLIQGMTEQEKDHYQILLPDELLPTRFDKLLWGLDKAIQDLFCYVQQNLCGYYDDRLLPDTGLDETFKRMRLLIYDFFKLQNQEDYTADTLRATVMKIASINFAINHIDANINIQNNDFETLPYDISHLKNIRLESEILPRISEIFSSYQKKIPNDIIDCAKLVCKMHILEAEEYKQKSPDAFKEFSELHMTPFCIAVSAALLSHDFFSKKELNSNIRGNSNNGIKIYRKLSNLSKTISSADALTSKILWDQAFPQELFKYLTSRYAITVRSFSSNYSALEIADARMKVRRKKFELQRETYELLKDMSIEEISACIYDFSSEVNDKVKSVGNTYNKLLPSG